MKFEIIKIKKMKRIILIALLFWNADFCFSQDSNESKYKTAKRTQLSKNKGDAVVEIARSFLEKPYVAFT